MLLDICEAQSFLGCRGAVCLSHCVQPLFCVFLVRASSDNTCPSLLSFPRNLMTFLLCWWLPHPILSFVRFLTPWFSFLESKVHNYSDCHLELHVLKWLCQRPCWLEPLLQVLPISRALALLFPSAPPVRLLSRSLDPVPNAPIRLTKKTVSKLPPYLPHGGWSPVALLGCGRDSYRGSLGPRFVWRHHFFCPRLPGLHFCFIPFLATLSCVSLFSRLLAVLWVGHGVAHLQGDGGWQAPVTVSDALVLCSICLAGPLAFSWKSSRKLLPHLPWRGHLFELVLVQLVALPAETKVS